MSLSFHDSGIMFGYTTKMYWTMPFRRKHPVNKFMLVYIGHINTKLMVWPISLYIEINGKYAILVMINTIKALVIIIFTFQ